MAKQLTLLATNLHCYKYLDGVSVADGVNLCLHGCLSVSYGSKKSGGFKTPPPFYAKYTGI